MNTIWTQDFVVHSYEVDFKHQLKLEWLCQYFLEAAWNHAEALGVGYTHLAQDQNYWVLSRLLLQIERLARWGEKVTLQTWPRAAQSVFALRDFELLDAAGQRLLAGTSAWLVLDAQRRRPQRLDKYVDRIQTFDERRALERDPSKLPAGPGAAAQPATPVRYSDIDVNRHVNSARYLGWVLDAYPLEFHREHEVRQVEVNYVGETHAGQQVLVTTQTETPGEYRHWILKEPGEEVCRVRVEWRVPTGTGGTATTHGLVDC